MAACTGRESDASSLGPREGREEYFEQGVEEEPQRSESQRCPWVAGLQKRTEKTGVAQGGGPVTVLSETLPPSQGSQSLLTTTALSRPSSLCFLLMLETHSIYPNPKVLWVFLWFPGSHFLTELWFGERGCGLFE